MEHILTSLKDLKDHNISVNMFNPDAYLFGHVNKYYDTPLTSSELMFVDATIPLLQLVTSGYMDMYSPNLNFASNETDTRLRLVEYGINPSYLLTEADVYDLKFTNSSNVYISEYQTLKTRMALNNNFIKAGLDSVAGQEMIDHTFLAKGVSLVNYANGISIIVNYTDQNFDYMGTIIIAKEYEIL
jgi:hypothetical protein